MAAIAATSAFAGTEIVSKEVIAVEPTCLFRDQEFQIDAFGLGNFAQGNTDMGGRPAWGGCLGLNYCFTILIIVGL